MTWTHEAQSETAVPVKEPLFPLPVLATKRALATLGEDLMLALTYLLVTGGTERQGSKATLRCYGKVPVHGRLSVKLEVGVESLGSFEEFPCASPEQLERWASNGTVPEASWVDEKARE